MLLHPRLRPLACALFLLPLLPEAQAAQPAAAKTKAARADQVREASTAQLFYEVLLGELTAGTGDPGTGYALMLQAARQSDDGALYRRAVEIALQARSGDAALNAAQAWRSAQPRSRDANRFVLQILVALNRVGDSAEALRQEIEQTPAPQRAAAIATIPRLYAHVSDKPLAAEIATQALQGELHNPALGAIAWTSIGQMRLAAADQDGAWAATRQALQLDPQADGPVLLALALSEEGVSAAEPLIAQHFQGTSSPETRMAYARSLLSRQRYPEAAVQLKRLTSEHPHLPDPWLLLATLQVQDGRLDGAETSLQHFMALADTATPGQSHQAGLTQAFLLQAHIAEKRQQYPQALAWLDRIPNQQELLGAQLRRASILVHQGQLAQARALIQALPNSNAQDQRMKLAAEVQLLREARQYQAAYELQSQLVALAPDDGDLLYDQAMLADKAGQRETMEQLLRALIAKHPDYHHAYNALGYSLADRGADLPEAKALVQKALEYAPGDPFITDSLGWVEFRLGNTTEALRLLEQAYQAQPDAEIAAHLGEVLWQLQRPELARKTWREGLELNPDNDTLKQTLQRLGVQP
ncbi:MAG: tetratricopeptide repeat protein [Comamonadaceae bacterium]|jgi:tetratricopeptide (TPR) repeat protein|nr:tetratricopeptide repeat protein [Comamonadaceae bacterium]